jgi:hypothetical protein
MTLNANVAIPFEVANTEAVNTEKRDTLIFFAFAAALVGAIVVAGLTVGLGGVGMIGIAGAAAMIVICLLLTAG